MYATLLKTIYNRHVFFAGEEYLWYCINIRLHDNSLYHYVIYDLSITIVAVPSLFCYNNTSYLNQLLI